MLYSESQSTNETPRLTAEQQQRNSGTHEVPRQRALCVVANASDPHTGTWTAEQRTEEGGRLVRSPAVLAATRCWCWSSVVVGRVARCRSPQRQLSRCRAVARGHVPLVRWPLVVGPMCALGAKGFGCCWSHPWSDRPWGVQPEGRGLTASSTARTRGGYLCACCAARRVHHAQGGGAQVRKSTRGPRQSGGSFSTRRRVGRRPAGPSAGLPLMAGFFVFSRQPTGIAGRHGELD